MMDEAMAVLDEVVRQVVEGARPAVQPAEGECPQCPPNVCLHAVAGPEQVQVAGLASTEPERVADLASTEPEHVADLAHLETQQVADLVSLETEQVADLASLETEQVADWASDMEGSASGQDIQGEDVFVSFCLV